MRLVKEESQLFARIVAGLSVLSVGLACAAPISAQDLIRGRVVDSEGRHLEGALVEAYGVDRRFTTTVTDGQGAFLLEDLPSDEPLRLTVSLLGYERGFIDLHDQEYVSVRLEAAPVPLPDLVVKTSRSSCPNQDSRAARELLEATQRRYSVQTLYRGGAYRKLTKVSSGTIEEVGARPDGLEYADERFVGARREIAAGRYWHVDERIKKFGYAIRREDGEMVTNVYGIWLYPQLHGRDAPHFTSEVFRNLHTFEVEFQDETEVLLSFCPVRRKPPFMMGFLTISRDSSITSVRWQFETASPKEAAGGEVVLMPVPADANGRAHLLPSEGIFWRRIRENLYLRQSNVFLEWRVSKSEKMPERSGGDFQRPEGI